MHKPKVISLLKTERYEDRFPGVPVIGKSVNLFLECTSYDLEIPVKGKQDRELDIFEETILRMIQIKKCSASELSEILCLRKDLIHFIICRMIEKGWLEDDKMTVTEYGKKQINEQSLAREKTERIQGKLFMVKKNGIILPYIHVGEFQSEEVDDYSWGSISIGFGTTGNKRTVYGRCLRNSDNEHRLNSILEVGVVKKAIEKYNRIARHAQSREVICLSKEYAITSSLSENVFFHLQAAVQEGNVDEVVFTDGFVHNIDGIMDYVRKEKPELLAGIKEKAVSMNTSDNEGHEMKYESGKYWQLRHRFEDACKHLPADRSGEASVDERKEINEGTKQIIIDCYHMLEWGFYYYTNKNQLSDEILNDIKRGTFRENAIMISGFAKKIGFQYVAECNRLFFHIDRGKIKRAYNTSSSDPDLYVCLPLAIAEAYENPDSEILRLARTDRGVLRFVDYLNSVTGDLRHDSEADATGMNSNAILGRTISILHTILPELSLDKDGTWNIIQENVSNARLLGQISLEKRLGSMFFSTMKKGLQNEWLKISPDKKGTQLPDPREYIEILYRILQTEIAEANKSFVGKEKKRKEDALAILTERCGSKVPDSFSRVREKYYDLATREMNATLGAEALVYIANVDDSRVEALNTCSYVPVLDQVLYKRGHGSMEVALNETEQTMNKLRDDVINLSKVIGGYYE